MDHLNLPKLSEYHTGVDHSEGPLHPYLKGKTKQREGKIRKSSIYLRPSFCLVDYIRALSPEQARKNMEKKFRENASRPLFTGTAVSI